MGILFSVVNIVLLIVLAWMLLVIVFQPRSRAQTAFILFDVFVLIFVFGLEMELLHSDTVDAALSGLSVQYLGQCGFVIALLWFADEFIQMKLPRSVFSFQMILSTITMFGILTAGKNSLFYTSMHVQRSGYFTRISCTNGILWYVHYIYFLSVLALILISCVVKYYKMGPVHRRRILYLLAGLGIFLTELVLKGLGLFGTYNPVGIALTGTVFCLMFAVIKEGYFASIDAAMENVLNHGDEGLIVLDAWSRIIFVNDRADHLFPGIRIGAPLFSNKVLSEAVKNPGENVSLQDTVWETRAEDIEENGVRTGTMLYFINVTDLVHQAQALQSVDEERVRFMTRASHELRSPLNVVLGADEMILRESQEPSIREYAGMIREEVDTMVNLVEDIINSALAEQKMLALKEESFSLKKVLLHLNAVYLRKTEDQGLTFALSWNGESADNHADVLLLGDKNRLLQILINLLDNAVKYTKEGSITLAVKTQSQQEGSVLLECIVQDTGSGIPVSEQKDIFEKYRRGKEAESTGKEGLGLGLSIVRSFVEAMGGTIKLTSNVGVGSRFTVRIPFKRSASSAEEKNTEMTSKPAEETTAFRGKWILIADDRPRNILVLRHLLKETGLVIDEADGGEKAVELCEKNHYDALILDSMMPGMDGAETLKAIRKDPKSINGKTYAIAFSANVTPDAEQMYHAQGFSDFLPKPVYYDSLVQALHQAFHSAVPSKSPSSPSSGQELQGQGLEDGQEKTQNNVDKAALLQRLQEAGVDTEAGIAYADDDLDFYLELLVSFNANIPQDINDLMDAYEILKDNDEQSEQEQNTWKEFTRIAHGIKGELRGFGDNQGGECFYTLEKAGKAKDLTTIERILPEAISHLEAFERAVSV